VTDAGVEELAGLTNFSTLAHDARGLSAMRVMVIGDSPDQMAGISIVASNRHVKWYTCRGRELFQKYERCARSLIDRTAQFNLCDLLKSERGHSGPST
jgi:hypothetical protein